MIPVGGQRPHLEVPPRSRLDAQVVLPRRKLLPTVVLFEALGFDPGFEDSVAVEMAIAESVEGQFLAGIP